MPALRIRVGLVVKPLIQGLAYMCSMPARSAPSAKIFTPKSVSRSDGHAATGFYRLRDRRTLAPRPDSYGTCLSAIGQQIQFLEHLQDPAHALLRGLPRGVNGHLRGKRRLVRIGNPGEVRYFARQRLLVEALRVTLHQDVDGTLHVYFDEIRNLRAHFFASATVGRNSR